MKNSKSQFLNTREETREWLDKYHIRNYTINDDLSVDVNGDVNLANKSLKIIPVKFGNVTGSFACFSNQLTNLVGSPETVDCHFWCQDNGLTSLIGSPKSVGRDFACNHNKLTSIVGSPKFIGGDFCCQSNPLTSLIEIGYSDFEGRVYFSIDENNFQQKELIKILEKYYNSKYELYELTNHQFRDTLKPQIEKCVLQKEFNKAEINIKTKNNFI